MAAQGDAGGKAEKMKEIPVLFNGAMVRAILDDRKTQTRRPLPAVFNSPPSLVHGWLPPGWRLFGQEVPDHWGAQWYGTYPSMVRSPLGKPGDRLWVRETFGFNHYDDGNTRAWKRTIYRADGLEEPSDNGSSAPWRPSIHMPRRFARLFLDVVDVRIERLQDISEEDARAEGIEALPPIIHAGTILGTVLRDHPGIPARQGFAALWTTIYGAESWAANPWVWVTEFKRVTQTL